MWVVNKSNPRGNINIQVNNGMGGVQVVGIPVTWIPIDVSMLAPRSSVLQNANFRRLVGAGFIQIVDSDSAEAFMQQTEAREEQRRISRIDGGAPVGDIKDEVVVEDNANSEEDMLSSVVQGVLSQDDLTESAVISVLRGQADILTEQDLRYLMQHHEMAGVKEWAAAQLAERG